MLRIINFKVDEALLEKIEVLAQKHKMNRSEFIRKAILFYAEKLERQDSGNTTPRIKIIG